MIFRNFADMKNIKIKCNPMVDLSKFTSNKKILNEVVVVNYKTNLLPKKFLKK